MKRYSFFVLLLFVLLFAGASCWTTTVNTNTNAPENTNVNTQVQQQVTLVINKGDGTAPASYAGAVLSGTTALVLLQSAATNNGFEITTQEFDFGTLVTGINGLAAADNKFWLFKVNGASATVGAGDYEVQPNDVIEFEYTASE